MPEYMERDNEQRPKTKKIKFNFSRSQIELNESQENFLNLMQGSGSQGVQNLNNYVKQITEDKKKADDNIKTVVQTLKDNGEDIRAFEKHERAKGGFEVRYAMKLEEWIKTNEKMKEWEEEIDKIRKERVNEPSIDKQLVQQQKIWRKMDTLKIYEAKRKGLEKELSKYEAVFSKRELCIPEGKGYWILNDERKFLGPGSGALMKGNINQRVNTDGYTNKSEITTVAALKNQQPAEVLRMLQDNEQN